MPRVLPSILILGLLALAAWGLAERRHSPPERGEERRVAARALALAVAAQGVHFAEEAATGFYGRFPVLFGLPAMPVSFFFAFNTGWLLIWVASVPGVRSGRPAAFFAAWFLALAGISNGIAHPLMAIAVRGYFPGLVSSPLIGAASVWLWLRLREATRTGRRPAS